MRSADWRAIRDVGYVLGALLLLVGLIAILYEEQVWFVKVAPYRNLGILLFIVGIALIVVGAVSDTRAKEEEIVEAERSRARIISVPLKKCPKCGMKFSPEYENCPRCKVKLVEGVVTKPKVEGKFFCRYCGKENKPDAVYCEACGKKL